MHRGTANHTNAVMDSDGEPVGFSRPAAPVLRRSYLVTAAVASLGARCCGKCLRGSPKVGDTTPIQATPTRIAPFFQSGFARVGQHLRRFGACALPVSKASALSGQLVIIPSTGKSIISPRRLSESTVQAKTRPWTSRNTFTASGVKAACRTATPEKLRGTVCRSSRCHQPLPEDSVRYISCKSGTRDRNS